MRVAIPAVAALVLALLLRWVTAPGKDAEVRSNLGPAAESVAAEILASPSESTTQRRAADEVPSAVTDHDPENSEPGPFLDHVVIRVVDDLGAPLEGASVQLYPVADDGSPDFGPGRRTSPPKGRTSVDGRVRLENVEARRWRVSPALQAYTVGNGPGTYLHRLARSGQEVEVLLRRPGALVVTVLDPSGRTVPDVHVRANEEGPAARTDAAGRAVFEALHAGPIRLKVEEVLVVGGDRVEVRPGETTEVRLLVRAGGAIEGRVLDPEGRAGWTVAVIGRMPGSTKLVLEPDDLRGFEAAADGTFRLAPLTTGTYRVAAGLTEGMGIRNSTRLFETAPVHVVVGEVTHVDVDVEVAPRELASPAHIELFDERGRAVTSLGSCEMRSFRPDSSPHRLSIGSVPPGRYRLEVTDAEDEPTVRWMVLVPG